MPEDKQNDIITGYTVQVMGPGFTEKREIPVMDGNTTSYEVSDLKPYTTYTFRVSAITEAGTGPAICVFSTTPQGGEIYAFTCIRMKDYHFLLDEVYEIDALASTINATP